MRLERWTALSKTDRLCRLGYLGVEVRANLESIFHRCLFFEVSFVWELTEETIHLPLGCLQGG